MSTKRQTDEEDAVSEHHTQWSTGAAQVVPAAKSLPATAGDGGDLRSVPGLGRSPAGGHGNTPQYSCLENPMDGGAWWATVHEVTKSWTQLSE